MLYIHPPLAIAGYVLIFFFATFLFLRKKAHKKTRDLLGVSSWTLTFLGLLSGMIWAQLAWGSYWSWDPKETLTLLLFLAVSVTMVANLEGRHNLAKWLSVTSCILVIATSAVSFIIAGLHSFLAIG